MTVATTEGGGALANPEDYGNLGLEDVGAADLMLPRINIDHDNAVFVNSLTKEEFPALTVVVLGLIKQRVMWPAKLEDDSKPRCKSTDNKHGFPNVNQNGPKKNLFPWGESNFTPDQMKVVEIEPGQDQAYPNGWSSNGYGTLPCDACVFAKWGKDEDGKGVPPPCNEQHTYPLLYMQKDSEENTTWVPAIFTVQRSAIKNSRAFINGFAQARTPFFTQYTGLTLRQESRGGNDYAVPEFKKMGQSNRDQWGDYANQLRGVRELIRMAPRPQEDDSPASEENTNTPSTPAAPPAAPPPAAEAPAPPAPPSAPPVPPTPPSAAPTPPTPPSPPAPPSAPAPPAPPSGGDSGLPF